MDLFELAYCIDEISKVDSSNKMKSITLLDEVQKTKNMNNV